MPTYQYACADCAHAFEQVQSFSDDALTVCPACEGRLRKKYSAVGVVFKGSGFYRNDSRPTPAGESSSQDSGSQESGAKESGTKDSGSDAGSKESGSKESGSKESGSKETASKGSGSKETGGSGTSSSAASKAS